MGFRTLDFDIAYLRKLATAGFDGIASRHERNDRGFLRSGYAVPWAPTAVGAAVGALSTCLLGKRKTSAVAIGGLLGSVIGYGTVLASRGWIAPALRRAARRVAVVRDARWLEANPIDYA